MESWNSGTNTSFDLTFCLWSYLVLCSDARQLVLEADSRTCMYVCMYVCMYLQYVLCMYVCMYVWIIVCMYKFIPGLNEFTSDSSVAKLRVSVLRPLNRYSRSLDRSTMYVPTAPQRPKLSPGEREKESKRDLRVECPMPILPGERHWFSLLKFRM